MDKEILQGVLSVMQKGKCGEPCAAWKARYEVEIKFCEHLLACALDSEYEDIVQLLIEHGVDVNVKFSNDSTPLHEAAHRGNAKIVKLLLDHGADLEAEYTICSRETPLTRAIDKGSEEIVRILLDSGANPNHQFESLYQSSLCRAIGAEPSNPKLVEMLLNKGAEIDQETVMFKAVSSNIEVFKLLVNKGIDVKLIENGIGENLLHNAAYSKNTEIVKYLLDHGVDVNKKDEDGNTPLHTALLYSDLEETIHLLIDSGANIFELNGNSETCLHLAATHSDEHFVEYFLNAGIDINSLDVDGETAIFRAAGRKRDKIVTFLLSRGLDINLGSDGEGETVIDEALTEENNLKVLKLLIMHIVQMMSEEFEINEPILNAIKKNRILRGFQAQCEREIQSMKSNVFDDSTLTIYDILLTESVNRFMAFARNENVKNVVGADDFLSKYPIYGSIVMSKFESGSVRNDLLGRFVLFFRLLAVRNDDRLPRLPLSCLHLMFDCLSKEDACNLSQAF